MMKGIWPYLLAVNRLWRKNTYGFKPNNLIKKKDVDSFLNFWQFLYVQLS